jgi:hypothetical protein
VRKYEQNGTLHPTVDEKGVHRFARDEVLTLERARGHREGAGGAVTGELAAKVFELFRDGVSLPDIVIGTKQSPATIAALWDDYRRLENGGKLPMDPFDLSDYDARARELDREIEERRRRRRE